MQKNERNVLSISNYKSCALDINNLSLTDEEIKKAKLVIVYYTMQKTGVRYITSAILNTEETEWMILWGIADRIGYVGVNKELGQLKVSTHIDTEFEVIGYNLIF